MYQEDFVTQIRKLLLVINKTAWEIILSHFHKIHGTCAFLKCFSFQLRWIFFFFGFLTDYQNISIKLLWKKDWSSQNSQRWNACFTECLMFPAGDCTVLRLCPKQYGWYSVVLEIDPLFPRYSLLSGGGGLVVKSCPTLVSPWTVACQAPLSVGFSRQEYWSGLLFKWKSLSGVWLFATPWAVQSMEFSRPEYSSG